MISPTGAWLVERSPDSFELVKSPSLYLDNGAAVFGRVRGDPELILAAGQWISIIPDMDHPKPERERFLGEEQQ